MTTIAFKDGLLAADTLSCWGGYFAGHVTKIHRQGRLRLGGAGSVTVYQQFRDWVRKGMSGECPLKKDIANVFLVLPDGTCVCWSDDGPFTMSTPTWAFGTGEKIAVGAMEMGASAEQAVRIAMRHDMYSGGDVTVLTP